MIQIHKKYGFIKGGACQKRLHDRKGRAEGARLAWQDMKDMKFVKHNYGWYQIIRIQNKWVMGKISVNEEIGYLRMIQVVFPQLLKQKQKFRLKDMDNWIEGMASCEFGISQDSPLSIITPGEKFSLGLMPPKPTDDGIYEKMYGVKRGLIKS